MTYDAEKETQLRLWVDGQETPFPEGSALFVQTQLEYIDAASRLRRTVNGRLVSTADPAFRKFRITLSGSDRILPAIAGIPPDAAATVHCPIVIRERGAIPSRGAVPGSVFVGPNSEWVEYRPVFECLVLPPSMSETEWESSASWSLVLEEV
ncbi:hypothetical protein [Roseovarius indicus]|uniref:hypothetical protein n=1 Tax=Roseovarius indicus TaxID=540747 RepID=UPI0040596ED3